MLLRLGPERTTGTPGAKSLASEAEGEGEEEQEDEEKRAKRRSVAATVAAQRIDCGVVGGMNESVKSAKSNNYNNSEQQL